MWCFTAACRVARKDLIDRFKEDPECRVFLSTDAGGVGLNLQHASVVMNIDLPWNPAVLEHASVGSTAWGNGNRCALSTLFRRAPLKRAC